MSNYAYLGLVRPGYLLKKVKFWKWGSRIGEANVMDCDIVIKEFEFQSRYYFHFWTNTFGKGMNPLIPLAMVWIVPLLYGFAIK